MTQPGNQPMPRSPSIPFLLLTLVWTCGAPTDSGAEEPKPRKIVLIAGEKDKGHPKGTHEYELSVRLLEHCLKTSDVKGIRVETHLNGWPRDERTLDDAATIV